MRLEACFDSHVHWTATGEFSQRLFLHSLKSPEEILQLRTETGHRRGDWLLGFGWDDNGWSHKPHRRILDQWQPDVPVALSRADGHALWVNTKALQLAGLVGEEGSASPAGGRIELDASGEPTGILIDRATERVQSLIPTPSAFEVRRHLLKAVQIFNEAGFTHIRDMTCDDTQWNEAVRLDQSGLLTLAVEEYFWLKDAAALEAQVKLAAAARAESSPNLRVKGLKIFLDGALGSEGAWISQCYHGRDHHGLVLWEDLALREVLVRAWSEGLEVAVHAIGDAACDKMVDIARAVKESGKNGVLHLEHAELLRPETLEKMKAIDVRCHLQPSHWLSDRKWLEQKVGELSVHAFPWRRLQEADIPFDFGSDSPIESASLPRTFQALRESAEAGVPRLLGSPTTYMSHSDLAWAPNSFTLLQEERPTQVVFRGEHIL